MGEPIIQQAWFGFYKAYLLENKQIVFEPVRIIFLAGAMFFIESITALFFLLWLDSSARGIRIEPLTATISTIGFAALLLLILVPTTRMMFAKRVVIDPLARKITTFRFLNRPTLYYLDQYADFNDVYATTWWIGLKQKNGDRIPLFQRYGGTYAGQEKQLGRILGWSLLESLWEHRPTIAPAFTQEANLKLWPRMKEHLSHPELTRRGSRKRS
jgi:hypothetical protein